MPKPRDPEVRALLVERAAEMLARREVVTLRALVAGTGVSTMAVYTYFDGMPGLWRAVRQEGFTRLAQRLALVPAADDAVHELAALGAVYLANATAVPSLYRAMFDTAAELEDPAAAGASFERLVDASVRARAAGRFGPDSDPVGTATRYWATGHGLAMLGIGGVLPLDALDALGLAATQDACVAAGDEPARAEASVRAGWAAGRATQPAVGFTDGA